ncbi:MAG TPA: hypothetical protein VIK56_15860, partial [Rhodoferax sp.]
DFKFRQALFGVVGVVHARIGPEIEVRTKYVPPAGPSQRHDGPIPGATLSTAQTLAQHPPTLAPSRFAPRAAESGASS